MIRNDETGAWIAEVNGIVLGECSTQYEAVCLRCRSEGEPAPTIEEFRAQLRQRAQAVESEKKLKACGDLSDKVRDWWVDHWTSGAVVLGRNPRRAVLEAFMEATGIKTTPNKFNLILESMDDKLIEYKGWVGKKTVSCWDFTEENCPAAAQPARRELHMRRRLELLEKELREARGCCCAHRAL